MSGIENCVESLYCLGYIHLCGKSLNCSELVMSAMDIGKVIVLFGAVHHDSLTNMQCGCELVNYFRIALKKM